MNYSVRPTLIALLTTLSIASCMKTSTGNTEYPDSTLITGRWQILRDSTYVGVGLGNHSERHLWPQDLAPPVTKKALPIGAPFLSKPTV